MSAEGMLVADIGGTRARFALLDQTGSPNLVRIFTVSDFPGPVEAIQTYLDEVGAPALQAAAIALAAPIHGEVVRLTNAAWSFSRDQLKSRLGLRRLLLLNDFTALALSLPHLGSADLRQVGAGTSVELAAKAVLGPGTGLGVSGVLFHRGCWLALSGEGGHCSLAPTDARESAILALAWRELGHVSAERLLSGSGLPLLNRLVAARRRPPRGAVVDSRDRLPCAVPAGRSVPGSDRNILRDARLNGRKSCADTRRPGWRLCWRWYHSKAGGTV
jgi:glucokinase